MGFINSFKVILIFCFVSVCQLLIAQQNNIITTYPDQTGNCQFKEIITFGQALPYNLYPHLWYDINPYNTGTIFNNNVNYDLVFQDEFTGSISDMQKRWMAKLYNRGALQNSSDGDPPEIISYAYNLDDPNQTTMEVSNGTLKLWVREITPTPFDCYDYAAIPPDGYPNNRIFQYVGADLWSIRNYKHGYFEARIKLPVVDVVWPAFWLYSGETEIDVFEFNNNSRYENGCTTLKEYDADASNRMLMSYHDWNYFDYSDHHACRSVVGFGRSENNFYFPNQWHNYGLYWDEFKVIWFVDGIPVNYVYKYYKEQSQPIGYNEYWNASQGIWDYLDLINNVYNGVPVYTNLGFPKAACKVIFGLNVRNYGGTYSDVNDQTCAPDLGTLPKNMEIDWIRVFANRSCESFYETCDESNLPTNIAAEVVYLPANGESNCEVVVRDYRPDFINNNGYWPPEQQRMENQHVDVVASDFAKLRPGFKVERGAYFKARIEDCYAADLRTQQTDTNNRYISNLLNVAYSDYHNSSADGIDKNISELTVSPNPFSSYFSVSSTLNSFSKLEIIDLSGRVVAEFSNGTFPLNIDGKNFTPGIYLLKIYSGNNMLTKKIIKTNA